MLLYKDIPIDRVSVCYAEKNIIPNKHSWLCPNLDSWIKYDHSTNVVTMKKTVCKSFIRDVLSKMEEYFVGIPFFFEEIEDYLVIKTATEPKVFNKAYDKFYVNFYYNYLMKHREEKKIVIRFVEE